MVISLHDSLGIERMQYDAFVQRYVAWRISDIPQRFAPWKQIQLPTDAVLHTCTGLDTMVAAGRLEPESDCPLVTNEKLPVYMREEFDLAAESGVPFPMVDTCRYQPARYQGQIQNFFEKNHKIHRLLTLRNIEKTSGMMVWFDYSVMNEMMVTGTFSVYRKWDIIFRSILDQVVQIKGDKKHFIHFPQNDLLFSPSQLRRAFDTIWRTTFPDESDPSIFPVVHLLAYVFGQTHHLNVKPYRLDKAYAERTKTPLPEYKSSSLFERLDDATLNNLHLVFSRGDDAIIYNMGDIKRFAQDTSFYMKVYRHLTNLRSVEQLPEHLRTVDDTAYHDYVETTHGTDVEPVTTTPDTGTLLREPEEVQHISPEAQIPTTIEKPILHTPEPVVAETAPPRPAEKPVVLPEVTQHVTPTDDKSLETHIREHVAENILNHPSTDDKLRQKTHQLLESHLSAQFNGAPLGSYLTNTTAIRIKKDTIPDIGDVADPSYRQSTIKDIDTSYMKHGFHQDLAKVISVLPRHGLFVKNIQTETTHTELDHVTTYRASLVDIAGKQHSIVFTLPVIDNRGYMRIGGVTYHMTRQIAGVPISKVSETRVNLVSNYNKAMVERVGSTRHRYDVYIYKYIEGLRREGVLTYTSGHLEQGEAILPFDYSAIAQKFSELHFGDAHLTFAYTHRFDGLAETLKKKYVGLEEKFGVYIGTDKKGDPLFMDQFNQIHPVPGNLASVSYGCFTDFVVHLLGDEYAPPPMISEWTQLKLLSATYPLAIVLGYRIGLKALMELIDLKYRFVRKGDRLSLGRDEITVKFADGTLIFSRYPLSRSLIMSGLNWANLSKVAFVEMEAKKTYEDILVSKSLSVNYLKGIDNFFEFFIDPITLEILQEMHEPTNVRDLLLKASVLLTDYSHPEPSSVRHHRFKGYERFSGFLYNEVARQLANYKNLRNSKKNFSINPQAVFQMIVQDQTMSPVNTINPLHEAKTHTMFTYGGAQGRTSTSFVTKDRVYPKDGVGIISENTPDSGKVGISAYTSVNPRLKNLRGMTDPVVGSDDPTLTPTQLLSAPGMTMVGVTKDDHLGPVGSETSYGISLN